MAENANIQLVSLEFSHSHGDFGDRIFIPDDVRHNEIRGNVFFPPSDLNWP